MVGAGDLAGPGGRLEASARREDIEASPADFARMSEAWDRLPDELDRDLARA